MHSFFLLLSVCLLHLHIQAHKHIPHVLCEYAVFTDYNGFIGIWLVFFFQFWHSNELPFIFN